MLQGWGLDGWGLGLADNFSELINVEVTRGSHMELYAKIKGVIALLIDEVCVCICCEQLIPK